VAQGFLADFNRTKHDFYKKAHEKAPRAMRRKHFAALQAGNDHNSIQRHLSFLDSTSRHVYHRRPQYFLLTPLQELRNAVYEYCRSEALATSNSSTQTSQEEHSNGAIQLLHVNRQVRSEFRPVFLEAFHLRARLEHLPAIVQLIEGARGSPSGTVVVDKIGQEINKRSINIAPFLRFCKTHENVKFQIVSPKVLLPKVTGSKSSGFTRATRRHLCATLVKVHPRVEHKNEEGLVGTSTEARGEMGCLL
jgi:hypothetical protein